MRLAAEVVIESFQGQILASFVFFEFEWTRTYRSSILGALLNVGFILKDMLWNREHLHQRSFESRADLRKPEFYSQIIHLSGRDRLVVNQEIGAQEAVLLFVQNAVDGEHNVICRQLLTIVPSKAVFKLQCIGKIVGRRRQALCQIECFLTIVHLEQRCVECLVNR
ncbi:hypothetical protein D3C87_1627530 [compost metagenome]